MSRTGIFLVILFTVSTIYKVQSECNPTFCSGVCIKKGFPAGNCNGDSCDCSFGKKCSIMKIACAAVCKKEGWEGLCIDDFCICRPPLKVCPPWNCTEQCLDDPRAKGCILVIPIACMTYGDMRTCICNCYKQSINAPTSDHGPSYELFQYNVNSTMTSSMRFF